MSYQLPGFISEPITEEAYPGCPLKLGDSSSAVLNTKNALNAISANFPAIPKITPVNSEFDESMEEAVKKFQDIFNLPVTGTIDKATWYEVRKIFSAVRKLAKSTSEELFPSETHVEIEHDIENFEVTPSIQLVQYFLNILSSYYKSIPAVNINGMFTSQTQSAIIEFQKTMNLPITGKLDEKTVIYMYNNIQGILSTLPPSAIALPGLLFPNEVYSEGSESPNVYIMQQYLNYISTLMLDIPPVVPNGIFGPETKKTVISFQNQYSLNPDGIIGKNTWNKIVEIYRQLRFSSIRTIGQFTGLLIG